MRHFTRSSAEATAKRLSSYRQDDPWLVVYVGPEDFRVWRAGTVEKNPPCFKFVELDRAVNGTLDSTQFSITY